ncbi:NKAP family protein-like [Durio zibethinus]|uniref:NKAP family protein-like n=1 Tax=Durio zibethinus TaxID=66656 RepID=A0A6P5WRZ2_DURZI|nr:NKAP family protein-like [Durio zibethinus]
MGRSTSKVEILGRTNQSESDDSLHERQRRGRNVNRRCHGQRPHSPQHSNPRRRSPVKITDKIGRLDRQDSLHRSPSYDMYDKPRHGCRSDSPENHKPRRRSSVHKQTLKSLPRNSENSDRIGNGSRDSVSESESDDRKPERRSRKTKRRNRKSSSYSSDESESESEGEEDRRRKCRRRWSRRNRKNSKGRGRWKKSRHIDSNDSESSGVSEAEESTKSKKRKSSSRFKQSKRRRKGTDAKGKAKADEFSAQTEALKFKELMEAQKKLAGLDNEPMVGPKPLPRTEGHISYGSALRPGEGDAIAQYVRQGKRIPRRGEVGLSAEDIQKLEGLGFVMSGSRNLRIDAIRIRKENQVYSAEDKRALAMFNYEEKAKRERKVMDDLRRLVQRHIGQDIAPTHDPFAGKNGADV